MVGQVITIAACLVTAYSPGDVEQGTGWLTSTGTSAALPGCSVDTEIIPYGSRVSVDGGKTWFVADDCGGGVKGHHVNLRFLDKRDAVSWGRQTLPVMVRPPMRKTDTSFVDRFRK